MNRRQKIGCIGLLAGSQLMAGCIVVGGGNWNGVFHTRFWTDEVRDRVEFDADQLVNIHAKTHNGFIRFEGDRGEALAYVEVIKKGGGANRSAAEAALKAIDVVVERTADGVQHIGWRWHKTKHRDWQARVSFEIHSPADVSFDGQTHNGSMFVKNAEGGVSVVSHNGAIKVAGNTGKLQALTHNGAIEVSYAGRQLHLTTHNGRIKADIRQCGPVAGAITTHNGGVFVRVGVQTSTRLLCQSHNGGIQCDAPLKGVQATKHHLSGTMGDGQGTLSVVTHNGGIRIRPAKNTT